MGICDRKENVFYRKTKKGNIIKIVREHYLRDDIWCGLSECNVCHGDHRPLVKQRTSDSSLVSQPHFLLIDTNVAIYQIDILSHDAMTNVIIPQTVLQEVRHSSLAVYKRLRDLIDIPSKHFYVFTNEHHRSCYTERHADESASDRNSRAVQACVMWYQGHFAAYNQGIVLLSDDKVCREKSKTCGFTAYSVYDYVASLKNAQELLDIVSQPNDDDQKAYDNVIFAPHWPLDKIRSGLKSRKLRQGVLKASRTNYLEANVMVEGMDVTVFIQGRQNLNRSINDDVVAVEILPEEQWSGPSSAVIEQENQDEKEENIDEEAAIEKEDILLLSSSAGEKQPSGRIVGIIRRKWRQYCGIVKPSAFCEATRHLFIPADKRIPFIGIETRQAAQLVGKRIIVAIDSWPRNSRRPRGHFVRVIGNIGEKETEDEVILLEHDCPHTKFSESVLKCLPTLPWLITEKDEAEREDLRYLDICSVDPVDCTDIDDALHCRELCNGNYEVGVHIADVSHFIRAGTALDKEAQNRSTTVYLVKRRIDMVPDLLSSNLCSLRGNTERFAFSVIWEMTPRAKILSTRFCKSIIRSRGELSYEEAQQRIDDPNMQDIVTKSLRYLNTLAKKLKKFRTKAGALVLASMEVKFHVDPDTDAVVDIVAKQNLETMSMVEEFMLLANISAAEAIFEDFPDCAMLRRHPAPPVSNFDPLLAAAKSQGISLDVNSNKSLNESLNKASKSGNPFFNNILRIMTTRCMMQALYFCSGTVERPEFYHYGLACPMYTHFTSPIRRYADIIVHRLLAVKVGADVTYSDLLNSKKCAELAQHINYRHKMAQYAGRSSAVVTAIAALKGKVSEYDGYIFSLHRNAIKVVVPAIGQQLTIYLDAKKDKASDKSSVFEFNEKELYLHCHNIELRSFDKLKVQLSVDDSDVQHQRVVTKLVEPYIPGISVESVKRRNNDDVYTRKKCKS